MSVSPDIPISIWNFPAITPKC